MTGHDRYTSFSQAWHAKAGVRSNPETYDLGLSTSSAFDNGGRSWHLPTYAGILQHPALDTLTAQQQEYVRGTQLLEFVTKQSRFEVDYVNWVASRLAHGKYLFKLPENLKLDALKIYTDEAYHAYYTQKIAFQITEFYGICENDIAKYVDDFYQRTETMFADFPEQHRSLIMLAFVIAGETQIVSDISEQMKGIVFEPIREMFRDHMRDEVFHAHYFSKVFEHCWPQLTASEKETMGLSFCTALEILSAPRTSIYHFSLGKIGYPADEIARFIRETYDNEHWLIHRAKERIKPTVELLSKHGVLDIPSVMGSFKERGYL